MSNISENSSGGSFSADLRSLLINSAICALVVYGAATVFFPGYSSAEDPLLAKGKEIYNGIGGCVACHGPEGNGDGPAAVALTPKPRSFAVGEFLFDTDGDGKKGTPADLTNVIINGAQKYNGSPLMVGRPDLSEADRNAVIQFVLSLKK